MGCGASSTPSSKDQDCSQDGPSDDAKTDQTRTEPPQPAAAATATAAPAESDPLPSAEATAQAPTPLGSARAAEQAAERVPTGPAAEVTDSNEAVAPPLELQSYVLISGIERRPELNGQVGLVVSFDSNERRYTVRVGDSLLSLRDSKLSPLSEMEYMQAVAAASPTDARCGNDPTAGCDDLLDAAIAQCASDGQDVNAAQGMTMPPPPPPPPRQSEYSMEAKMEAFETLPMGELTAKGALVPSYYWVKVPNVATLPPGMEVWMPLVGLKCARIPSTWRLQVVAEGQVDSYRCDVGEHTLLAEVRRGAATTFGWDAAAMELRADGGPLPDMADPSATVGSASLFGRKLTARRSCP